jgi:hypothetical protein
MKSDITITKEQFDKALSSGIWRLGNQVLYDLCRNHPKHDSNEVIVAKVWLIGRSYAAALERRRNPTEQNDNFYEDVVAPVIRQSDIDQWLSGLNDGKCGLAEIVTVHKRVTNLFFEVSGMEKRSLASKYLHFHRPDLFYIYDSRALESIRRTTPGPKSLPRVHYTEFDAEYLPFCQRCDWLVQHIADKFGKTLDPRQLDNLLLSL